MSQWCVSPPVSTSILHTQITYSLDRANMANIFVKFLPRRIFALANMPTQGKMVYDVDSSSCTQVDSTSEATKPLTAIIRTLFSAHLILSSGLVEVAAGLAGAGCARPRGDHKQRRGEESKDKGRPRGCVAALLDFTRYHSDPLLIFFLPSNSCDAVKKFHAVQEVWLCCRKNLPACYWGGP